MPRTFVLALLVLATAPCLVVADDPADETIAPARVAELVRRLGDDDFFAREAATRALWEAGPEATRTALERARDEGNSEVAFRANRILWNFEHGILVGTPPEVVTLVAEFHEGNPAQQAAVFRTLSERGHVETMKALFGAAPDASRKVLVNLTDTAVGQQVPALLAAGKFDEAESWLELGVLANPVGTAASDLDVLLLLRGGLPERIERLRAELPERPSLEEGWQLARPLWMLGELDEAAKLADRSGAAVLDREIAFRRGDWKSLEEMTVPLGAEGVERLGFELVIRHLAGRDAKADETAAALRELARADAGKAWMCGEALLIAERWEDALAVYREAEAEATVFELLAARNRYAEAFAAVGLPEDGSDTEAWFKKRYDAAEDGAGINKATGLAITVARELARSRGSDAAESLLDAIRTANPDNAASRELIEAYDDLGFRETALREAAASLVDHDVNAIPDALRPLFNGRERTAFLWWQFRRGVDAEESPADSLTWVDGLLDGKEVGDFAELAAKVTEIGTKQTEPNARLWWLTAVADAAIDREAWDVARSARVQLATDGTSTDAYLQVGDVESKRGDWEAAADWYGRAREVDPRNPLATLLQGLALVKAGRDAEGQRLIELGRILPLSRTSIRSTLANELDDRGFEDEARREWELILRVGSQGTMEGTEPWPMQLSFALLGNAISDDEPLRAADCWQRYLFYMLQSNAAFTETRRYHGISHLHHRGRATGLAESGEFDAAVEEARRAHAAWPGNIELALTLVPLLDEAGRKREAETVFELVDATAVARVAAFPESPGPRNDLAWLRAKCDRKLDEALADSDRAVAAEPESSAYVDTLAEVHFRRGNVERAIELAERCLELDPDGEHYRQQLDRFRAALKP